MCIIYCSSNTFEPTSLSTLEFSEFTRDWHGNPPSISVRYQVVVDPDSLIFSFVAELEPDYDTSLKNGQFQEGLWERDVMEIFIAEDNSRRYQEFNVAPSGAWWSCVFDRYREPSSSPFSPPKSLCVTSRVTDIWSAELRVKRSELGVTCGFSDESRLNVCGIFGQNPRTYLTAYPFLKKEPDFHLATKFPPAHRIRC